MTREQLLRLQAASVFLASYLTAERVLSVTTDTTADQGSGALLFEFHSNGAVEQAVDDLTGFTSEPLAFSLRYRAPGRTGWTGRHSGVLVHLYSKI